MSDVIKLNVKKKKMNVSLKNSFEAYNYETEREEDYFQNQLKQHYEHGYAEGQKFAQEKFEKEYSEKLLKKFADMQKMLSGLDMKMVSYTEDFERVVINIALVIAEKILRRELMQENIVPEILQESLKRVIGANNIVVKINPADLETLNNESDGLFGDDSFSKIKFEPDVKVEQGGCLVETEIGNVDARVSSRFNELKKQLESIFTVEGV